MDEHRLSLLEPAETEETILGGIERLRCRGGGFIRHIGRNRDRQASIDNQELGIGAPTAEPEDPISTGKSLDALARSRHLPGELQAENIGLSRRGRIKSATLQQIGAIEPGGEITHQQLAGTRPRLRKINDFEHIRPARLFHLHAAHGAHFTSA